MNRRRAQGLIGGGVVALLAVLAVPAKRGAVAPQPPPQVALALRPVVTGMTLAVAAARIEAQRLRTESNAWGRDPFARAPEPDTGPSELVEVALPTPVDDPRLGGISRAGTSWLALVDGQLARMGEVLRSGHTVVAITDESVTLRRNEHELILRLGGTR